MHHDNRQAGEHHPDGVRSIDDKVEPIVNFPRPANIEQLHRFLDMVNFYRSQLPIDCQTELNAYLHNTKKRDKTLIEWTDKAIEAFEKYKASLKSAVANVRRFKH